jgi:MoaA/NifB/PqqE/SkfB family radical SAM enzyme
MPFCHSPWTNIDISPNGNLSPCCKYQFAVGEERFNIKNNTIEEYKHSEFLNGVKQIFTSQEWPRGCERCRIEEQNNIKSKRQLDYDRWQQHYSQIDLTLTGFITASVAFGNTCNLTCITCGPQSSSRWQREYETVYNKKVFPFHFYKQNFVDDFVQQAPDIIHVDIPGGEPFLSGIQEQKKLLEHYIQSGQASKISLHYTTNATVYPDDSWRKLWEHFKEIDLQLSLDGIEQRFEYVRYPASWNTVNQHVLRYIQSRQSNLRLSVSHTVSAYNIYYLDEFLTWCNSVGLPRPWMGRVHSPAHMRPSVWPLSVKSFIIAHLNDSSHDDCAAWAGYLMQHDDSDQFEKFIKYLHQHDQYRNLNFKTTFSELAKFI